MSNKESESKQVEQAIETCVRVFYDKARRDASLGPIFDAHVHDWDVHFRVVSNFWSKVLLKTERYSGSPYVAHVNLPIRPQHIDRWLELFVETVHEIMPEPYAQTTLAKARKMGESFKAGLFPFTDKDGTPSRHPA